MLRVAILKQEYFKQMCFWFCSLSGSRVQVSVIVPGESRCYRYQVPAAGSALSFSTPRWEMESALGDETGGPTLDRLQESNISDLVEDTLSLRSKDELETIPVEEIRDLKPEDLQESAPPEATQDTKPGTGQVQQRDNCRLKAWGIFTIAVMYFLAIRSILFFSYT